MDIKQLREMQSWSLGQKMYHSMEVIDTFYQRLSSHNSLTLDNISASSIFFSFKII
jgi:hypothetical protein